MGGDGGLVVLIVHLAGHEDLGVSFAPWRQENVQAFPLLGKYEEFRGLSRAAPRQK